MDNPSKILVEACINLPQPQSSQNPVRSSSSSTSASRRTTRSTASKLFGLSGSKSPTTSSVPRSPSLLHATPRYTKYTPKPDEPFTCPICYDDSSDITTLSLDCGHTFCHTCWNMFLLSKIRDEGEHVVRCMAEGCQPIPLSVIFWFRPTRPHLRSIRNSRRKMYRFGHVSKSCSYATLSGRKRS